ncbi:NAD-dependent epimerase/dehydratase family protein, partial [Rhizobium ruizarguesonis]
RYILVTGGAGFIGSHICKALSSAGMIPVTYDNLSTGHAESVRWGPLIRAELADAATLRRTLEEFSPDCVIHCGANAYVGES